MKQFNVGLKDDLRKRVKRLALEKDMTLCEFTEYAFKKVLGNKR